MNILITGGLGFIGFNFIKYIIKNKLSYKIINIDKITYAASHQLAEKFIYFEKNNIINYLCDICNYSLIKEIIITHNIDCIINFAAETHVDNSIKCPDIFIKTNIEGTLNLLKLSNEFNLRFHQISTDEVYGAVDPYNDIVKEDFKYNAASPYSASKASADLLCLAFYKTFGTKITISRCTNNFGPYQHPEKLIPKVITNALNDIKIPVYGDGKQIRNWIYVDDHNDAILKIIENGKVGEIYNIGSDTLIPNIDVIKTILKVLNKSESLIDYVTDRPGHDFAYHLNSEKIKTELNWENQYKFEDALIKTINWFKGIQI
jgi:dTDP-glucose 4,6-dehydratase